MPDFALVPLDDVEHEEFRDLLWRVQTARRGKRTLDGRPRPNMTKVKAWLDKRKKGAVVRGERG